MKDLRCVSDLATSVRAASRASRRRGITVVALTALVCCGYSSSAKAQVFQGSIGPSGGEIVAAAVGVGVAVATIAVVSVVAINNSHHTLKGCAFAGPNGLKLQASDSNTYAIEGDTAGIKAGDKVKLHGSKVKKTKGSSEDHIFKVEKLKKDYGPCQVNLAQASSMAR